MEPTLISRLAVQAHTQRFIMKAVRAGFMTLVVGNMYKTNLDFYGDSPDKEALAMTKEHNVYCKLVEPAEASLTGSPTYEFMGSGPSIAAVLQQYGYSELDFE